MTASSDMSPAARDGELILYVDRKRERGQLYNEIEDTWGEVLSFQALLRWGNFEPIDEAAQD